MAISDVGIHIGSDISRPATYAVVAFFSIALYNVLELTFLVFLVFKHHAGLYFWSFLVATWGIAIYAIGFILDDFRVNDSIRMFNVTLIVVGWCAMVTGQSLVLYSRLHLIVRRRIILRFVLGMIITNAILLHIPTIILCYGANSAMYQSFAYPYGVYERIQVTIFFLQETTISAIYMYQMCRLFYTGGSLGNIVYGEAASRRLMLHLIYVNVIVILLDIAIPALQFSGRYASQTAAKGFIYSVKLKLEFNILNRLVELAQRSRREWSSSGDRENATPPDFGAGQLVDQTQGLGQGTARDGMDPNHRRRKYQCPWHLFTVRVREVVSDRTAYRV
ncbi:hypothetical protein BJY01DRAFT_261601 [Aspergillus pseudoustus]|uniref:DUF7703 domain-containing protein n=1 Tax=Aspergillus pseudoustus TaxID=1810923 RepID=A0ABR4IM56_9EURO